MDRSALEFLVKASDACLVKQLSGLLQARDLSIDELGLLYCYKHGVSVPQALKMLGHEGKLQDFLKAQKEFRLDGGRVGIVREDAKLKQFPIDDEVSCILKANAGCMDVKDLCSALAQKFNVSLSSLVGMRPIDYFSKENDLFTIDGRGMVLLRSMRKEELTSESPQSMPETSPAISAPPGLEDRAVADDSWSADSEQYMELHNRISSRSFNSKAIQILADVVEIVLLNICLNVDHVVKGGSVGKGTAFIGCTDAEAAFFLKGLPCVGKDSWLPPLLKAVVGMLTEQLESRKDVESIGIRGDSVQLCLKDMVVELRFTPAFDAYSEVLQVMKVCDTEARKAYAASLAKERVQFISRQPGHVKVTMRLLKWWRDQQPWSSKLTWPKDEVLELMAIYSAVQTKPGDQRIAIANVMSLLSRFNEMRIVWSNYYGKDDVWAPLLRQRPLLMDPTNPSVNVADAQAFDAQELMEFARTTHFFW
jgi:hypothetical protein